MSEIITINNEEYIKYEDVIKQHPNWVKGARNGRELVKQRKVRNNDYTYTLNKNGSYIISNSKVLKAIVLFKKTFFELNKKILEGTTKKTKKVIIEENIIIKNNNQNNDKNDDIIEEAPEIITLNDREI